MKQVSCSQLGGPATCTTMFSADTPEDMITKAWEHLQEAHPEQAATIKSNSKEVNDAWMAKFKAETWPTLAEAPSA